MYIERVDCHAMWMKPKGVTISMFTRLVHGIILSEILKHHPEFYSFHTFQNERFVLGLRPCNRTDILLSKCSMIQQYGWTVQALDLLTSSSSPAPDCQSEIFDSQKSWVQIINHRPMNSALISWHLKAFLTKKYN